MCSGVFDIIMHYAYNCNFNNNWENAIWRWKVSYPPTFLFLRFLYVQLKRIVHAFFRRQNRVADGQQLAGRPVRQPVNQSLSLPYRPATNRWLSARGFPHLKSAVDNGLQWRQCCLDNRRRDRISRSSRDDRDLSRFFIGLKISVKPIANSKLELDAFTPPGEFWVINNYYS